MLCYNSITFIAANIYVPQAKSRLDLLVIIIFTIFTIIFTIIQHFYLTIQYFICRLRFCSAGPAQAGSCLDLGSRRLRMSTHTCARVCFGFRFTRLEAAPLLIVTISVYLSIYLSIYRSIHPSIYLSIYLCI